MGARGRLIASVFAALVVVVAVWLIALSPQRSQASSLLAQIATERQTLSAAQAQLLQAQSARVGYRSEVHALDVLLDAIPASDQEPQLIGLVNALEAGHVINWKQTSFAPTSADGFTALNISFSFQAGYLNLQKFLIALDALNKSDGTNLVSSGRLATVSALELSPSGKKGETATVAMTVYEQPAGSAPSAPGTVTTTAAAQQ